MAFQVIPPRRLYQEIALQIKAHIESGEFSVGARLPAERELAQQLKVSRPSVREALIALEVEGLVEVKTGAGVFVCERRRPFPSTASYEGPIEIMLARALIEGDIAARAATKMRNADIKELERIVKAMNPSPTEPGVMPSERSSISPLHRREGRQYRAGSLRGRALRRAPHAIKRAIRQALRERKYMDASGCRAPRDNQSVCLARFPGCKTGDGTASAQLLQSMD